MREWVLRVLAAVLTCSPAFASGRNVIVNSKDGNPLFDFVIFDAGETFWNPNIPNPGGEDTDSAWTMSDAHLDALRNGADYWAELLGGLPAGASPVVINVGTENVNNAYALTLANPATGYTYPVDWALNGNVVNPAGQIVMGYGFDGRPTYNGAAGVLPSGAAWDGKHSSGTVAHEMGHLMGITSYSAHINGTSFGYGGLDITVALGGGNYDAHLYDSFGRAMTGFQSLSLLGVMQRELGTLFGTIAYGAMQVAYPDEYAMLGGRPIYDVVAGSGPVAGKFTLKPDDGDANYDEGEYAYFKGGNVAQVLRGADVSRGGNITDAIPINIWENGHPEMSHVELRNSMMSHQWYRNFGTFMEAELAMLQDIGINLSRGAFYGSSVYGSNTSETITRGLDSDARWAIGLHVYGTNNTLSMNGDVRSGGDYSVGARIDGWENALVFNNVINMPGKNSAGIMASYGKEHDVEVKGSVSAEIGLLFDFGDNQVGNSVEYRGSYIRTSGGTSLANANNLPLLPELSGALVDRLEINGGKIMGAGGTAIKIAQNAFVRNILISGGGEIRGDIVSEWNPFLNQVQYAGDKNDLITAIELRDAKLSGSIYAPRANVSVSDGLFLDGDVNANSFLLTGELTLDIALGKTTISANNADFASGSVVRLLTEGGFGYGEYEGAEFSVLDIDSASFADAADYDFSPSGEFDRGFYRYRYSNPAWRAAGGVNSLYVSADGKELVSERTGISAAKLPLALARHSTVSDMLADRLGKRMNDDLRLDPTGVYAAAGLQLSNKLSSRAAAFGADVGKHGFFVAGLQFNVENMKTSGELAELDSAGIGLDAYAGFYMLGGFRIYANVGAETLSYSHSRVVDGALYGAEYKGRVMRMGAAASRPISFNYGRFVATPGVSVGQINLSVGGAEEIGSTENKYALGFAPQEYGMRNWAAGIDFSYNPRRGLSYDCVVRYRKWIDENAVAARVWFVEDKDKSALDISEEADGMDALILGFGISSGWTNWTQFAGRYKIIIGEWAAIHNLSASISIKF
ncbi:MAG: autotransporter outer membrane beta-barrel domain-containing protein [Rickettsiales bacterium]|jgi:hypothetical protein|nr:autotransporter outer membrane beta-barrel domain-containing protein [Rickettsiales bacterium]